MIGQIRSIMLLACLVELFILLGGAQKVSCEVRLTLNEVYPANNLVTKGVVEFANKVKEYTKGNVLIEVHPGGSLGYKGPELLGVVKEGIVPMSDINMGSVEESEKVFSIPSLPRLALTYEEVLNLYNTVKPLYDKAAEKWNQKILYVVPWPPSGLFTKNEIKTPSDLKGLRVRVYSKQAEKMFSLLSANPVFLSWVDVPNAIRQGQIDAVVTSAASGAGAKFWEMLKYFTPIQAAFPLSMVTINLKAWDVLSQNDKSAMEKAAAEIQAKQWEASKTENVEAVKTLISNGVIINMGGGATSETRHGIKVMADSGVLLSALDRTLQAELDSSARKIIDEFIANSDKEISSALRSYLASAKR
jgi:TRAP-type C4-dicarboxylate transport system substrate-binding protein